MPFVTSRGARLYYEEHGSGRPIVFVHEFGADLREWAQQVNWFSREYRCIAFNARGYPPSEVPESGDLYGYEYAADDILAVLDGLAIERAHVVGLSMGAYATLQFGLRHPGRASSLVVAGVGSGAPREHRAEFKEQAEALALRFLDEGAAAVAVAEEMALGATRVQLLVKDPAGWERFKAHLSEHSAIGSAHTLRRYQALRPSLYDYEGPSAWAICTPSTSPKAAANGASQSGSNPFAKPCTRRASSASPSIRIFPTGAPSPGRSPGICDSSPARVVRTARSGSCSCSTSPTFS